METTLASMETDMLKTPIKVEECDQQVTQDKAALRQDSPSPEQLAAVAEFCVEALGRSVLSLTDLRNRLLLKQTSLAGESPLHVLSQQGVSDHLLGEGLRHCGAVEVGQPWNKSLFALTLGDPVREILQIQSETTVLYDIVIPHIKNGRIIFQFVVCVQCREATLNLFRSERSMKKKQLLDELTKRGLTDDIKVVSSILKVHNSTHATGCVYQQASPLTCKHVASLLSSNPSHYLNVSLHPPPPTVIAIEL
jgi:hypothetical protein